MRFFWQKSAKDERAPRRAGEPFRVMFVCIGNSCRSPMAEAFARARHADVIEPYSAGIEPAPIIQPETYECMEEKGVSLEGQGPKRLKNAPYSSMDLIVNLTEYPLVPLMPDFESSELMPLGPEPWPVADPIGQELSVYRIIRDDIEQRVARLADQLRERL